MHRALALLALAGSSIANPMPQAVTGSISAGSPPSGCQTSVSGTFAITVVNVTSSKKRDIEERQSASGILTLTLEGGILKDAIGRTGYIAANNQFQFDKPPQNGAIYTAGFSVCANNSLALGGSAIWYQCKSGGFYNLYDKDWAAQCSPIYIEALTGGTTASTPAAGEKSEGQPTATTAVTEKSEGQPAVTQISDGQPQAITQLSDGQPEGPGPVTQISDGQPQAGKPTTGAVSEASEGQPRVTSAPAVSEASEGQPRVTSGAVSEASEGQPRVTSGAVSEASEGQPRVTSGAVSEASEGQPRATGNATVATSSPAAQFTGAAAPVKLGQEILGAGIGIMAAVALL